jgi:hypothetical protein
MKDAVLKGTRCTFPRIKKYGSAVASGNHKVCLVSEFPFGHLEFFQIHSIARGIEKIMNHVQSIQDQHNLQYIIINLHFKLNLFLPYLMAGLRCV